MNEMDARSEPIATLLSERQRQIARLVATGASNKQIARQLAISEKTVKNTLTNIYVKTHTSCRTELAINLVRSGLEIAL